MLRVYFKTGCYGYIIKIMGRFDAFQDTRTGRGKPFGPAALTCPQTDCDDKLPGDKTSWLKIFFEQQAPVGGDCKDGLLGGCREPRGQGAGNLFGYPGLYSRPLRLIIVSSVRDTGSL